MLAATATATTTPPSPTTSSAVAPATRAEIMARYGHAVPHSWGFDAPGVVHELPTAARREIALTFDACGGPGGSGYDRALIDFLCKRDVPATLFL
ncbi:polysaccharide deacetylase family protein, partial [Streptomyces sp. NPDC004009]